MSAGLVCLVTVHGIGFQQSPCNDRNLPGYADDLQRALRDILPDLGDDPNREKGGAVYVAGPGPRSLDRLDPGQPLAGERARFAHVAIVYTGYREGRPDRLGLAGIGVWSVCYALDYTTPLGGAKLLIGTLQGLRRKGRTGADAYPGSMRLRNEAQRKLLRNRLGRPRRRWEPTAQPSGPFTLAWQVSEDVGGYVMRHKFRERVRGFVEVVLTRLHDRPDVRAIVLNAHSNGTVIGFDVLSDLDGDLGVRGLVTAGSPLRKYATLFGWGTDAGRMSVPWINVWDRRDPVADPLQPPATWRRGDRDDGGPGLFSSWSPEGEGKPVSVIDKVVDNVRDARTGGGGLRAHDYWANPEFYRILATALQDVQHDTRDDHDGSSGMRAG